MLEKGLAAKVPRSYRSDIEKLKAHSARSVELLSIFEDRCWRRPRKITRDAHNGPGRCAL